MPALDRRPSCSRVLADVEMAALEGKLALLESQRQLSAVKCRIFVDKMESTMQCAEESTIEKYAAYTEKDTDLSFEVPAYEPYSKRDNGLARTLSSSGAKQRASYERLRAPTTDGSAARSRNSSSGGGGGGGSSGDGLRAYEPFAPPRVDGAYRRRSIDVPSVSLASARCASWREDMIFYTPSASGIGSPARHLSRRRSGSFRAPVAPRGTPDAACAEALPRDVFQYDLPRGGGEARRAATGGRRSFHTTREQRYGQGVEDRCAAAERAELSGAHWPASQLSQRSQLSHSSQPNLRSQASLRSRRLSQRDLASASNELDWLADPSLPSRASTEPPSNGCARSTSSSSFIVLSVFSSSNSIASTSPFCDSSLETGSSRSSSPASASSASPSSPEASARLRSPWTNAAGPFHQLAPVFAASAPCKPPFSAASAHSVPTAQQSTREPTQNGPSDKEETSKSRGGSWRRRAQPKAEERAEKGVEAQGKPSAPRDRRRMSLGGFASSLLGDLRYK
ncbi:unnamed protein product [Closterium sp. NIES-53]